MRRWEEEEVREDRRRRVFRRKGMGSRGGDRRWRRDKESV